VNTQLTAALIGGVVALCVALLSNILDRKRALRLKETEFKIARYQEFLFTLSAGSNRNYKTQLDFVKSLNVISLMASEKVLKQVNALVENYNNPEGTTDAQAAIIKRIIFEMRCDLGGKREAQVFANFEFPIIFPDIPPDEPQRA
jgi:hypothetical protein